MFTSRVTAFVLSLVYLVALTSREGAAADFSSEALALPFPPDARELEFVAWAGDINYKSNSPLKSLAAFYLKEMESRGWQHDESAADVSDDSIKLTFKHDPAKVKVELRQWSKEVRVSLDCEKLQFTGTDDLGKLAAAGIPVPRALMALQKDFPLPDGAVSLRYTGEGCTFKSPLKLQEAFDHFVRLAPNKGFRESRRPISTDTRRYTEFKKGSAQFSVNVFTDEVGSRIILEYKDSSLERPVPPLAAVASLPIKGGAGKAVTSDSPEVAANATPIDVTSNKGSATISYNGRQYVFPNVAAFRTKSRGDGTTMVVFSAKPIPFNKMQSLISKNKDFSFGDLYELGVPEHLDLQISGEHISFHFALSSVSVGNSVDNAVNEVKIESDRVRGTLKMPTKKIFDREPFSFTATMDAAVIMPSTRISGLGDPVVRSDSPVLKEAPIPFPDGVENAGREGSKFRKTYTALVRMPVNEVAEFYRKELVGKGWALPEKGSADSTMWFRSDAMEMTLTLKPQRDKTTIEVLTRDKALAKQEGIIPEPGKGRLVLGNGSQAAVVFTVGTANYSLRAGQGAKDTKQAVNVPLAPGTYTVLVKVPGQPQHTERVELTEGTAWGIIALPTGVCFAAQLY